MLVAGVDSSTQSTKVLLCQADDGAIVGQAAAPHPDGTECDPELWWRALAQAGDGLLNRADAIGVAAQQHGMVVVDEAGQVIRPALLWNDVRSAPQAAALIDEMGGPGAGRELTGSVPTASFTVTKLRWLAEHEPDAAARTAHVMLPHDWLTWRLGDRAPRSPPPTAATPRAPATSPPPPAAGCRSWPRPRWASRPGCRGSPPRPRSWPGLLAARRCPPEPGTTWARRSAWASASGEVVVSIGTSGTAYAVAAEPAADETGAVAGFADATGRFLPLVATINAARVLTVTARMLGTDADGLSRLALAAPPGAQGLTLLPYLDAAIEFYCQRLGFEEELRSAPAFAMLYGGGLRLLLSVPGLPSAGRALPDGTVPAAGGSNRITLQVTDVTAAVAELRAAGVRIRADVSAGVAVRQALIEDPAGNLVELYEPAAGYHERSSAP